MSKSSTNFIGMDVYKETTDVAFVSNEDSAVSFYGTIPTNSRSTLNLIKKFNNKASKLVVVYEAGPCGYWLYRLLKHKGIECWVVAPSLIPKAPGDKVKTDRRDAMTVAGLPHDERRYPLSDPALYETRSSNRNSKIMRAPPEPTLRRPLSPPKLTVNQKCHAARIPLKRLVTCLHCTYNQCAHTIRIDCHHEKRI